MNVGRGPTGAPEAGVTIEVSGGSVSSRNSGVSLSAGSNPDVHGW